MMIMFRIIILLLLYNSLICSGKENAYQLFRCYNGKNIKSIFKCDNDNDCGDNSDENNCYNRKFCSKNDFQCMNDRQCIPKDLFCDGDIHCIDKSDEYDGCKKDLNCEDRFRCTNGYCLMKGWMCDGMKDCLDGSDELHCDERNCKAENHRYICKNNECISLDWVCDNVTDCSDGSDEGSVCNNLDEISCSSEGCSHNCIISPNGVICTCPQGYKFQNNDTCIDIDECADYTICDQQCINTEGSYKCICQKGYTLQSDMKTCKADGGEAMIIFSTGTEIRGMYLDSKVNFSVAENLNQVVSIATDGEYIYWSENSKTITKNTKEGKREHILITGLHKLSDIAVDWITGNIYFTDRDNMNIGVCDNNGTYCTVLINGITKVPTSIALLPTNGIMYWCDSSYKPYIGKAGMDGNGITLFVTKKLKYPTSLTVDYPNNRLYWLDTVLKVIESIQLDGTDRKIISRDITYNSISLAIFENILYWIMGNERNKLCNEYSKGLIKYRKAFFGKTSENLINGCWKDLQIYHPVMKFEAPNACTSNSCSQLCLLNQNKNYTCACTLDKTLNFDGHTCQDIKDGQHIILVADGTFVNYYHKLLGKPKITKSVTLKHITAVTYDSLSGTILASNALTNNIFRYNLSNGEIKNFISMNIESLGGMAFDHIGNNLYLTNIEKKTIEVRSLTTEAKKIFFLRERPHGITLAPEEGIMFVVLQMEDKYRIDKMSMNGKGTKSIFVENILLSGPNISLFYHSDEKRIFWSDQRSIQSASLTGFDYQIFRTGLKNIMSLAVAGEYIFWTISNSDKLFWANKNHNYRNNIDFAVYLSQVTQLSHLIIPNKVTIQEYGCHKNNGNCSHVCLPSPATSYTCACPPELTLSANNHTCILQNTCSFNEIKCIEYDICIKLSQWCNGVENCPNGEDETDHCKNETSFEQIIRRN